MPPESGTLQSYLIAIRGIQVGSCNIECDVGSILDRVTVDTGGQGRERLWCVLV